MKLSNILARCVVLIAGYLVSLMVVSLTEQAGGALIYNSDLIQPYLVMHDLFLDASSIRDWYLSPANFVFPDCFYAALLTLLKIKISLMPIFNSGFILTLYAIGGGALLASAGAINFLAGTLVVFFIEWSLLWIAAQNFGLLGSNMTGSLAASFIHTGSIVNGLVSLTIAISIAYAQTINKWSVVALLLVCLLAGYSDIIVVPWFLLPVVALWLVAFPDRSNKWWVPLAMLLAAGVGALCDVLTRHRPPAISTPEIGLSLATWVRSVAGALERGDWLLLGAILLGLAMLVDGGIRLVRSRVSPLERRDAVLLALEVVQVAALATPLIMGAMTDPANFRYSLPAFLIPYLWLAVYLLAYVPSSPKWVLARVLGGTSVLALGFAAPSVNAAMLLAQPLPVSLCLMKNGLTSGISDYWNAKRVIFDTNYTVSIIQVDSKGNLYRWNVNSRWFKGLADGSEPARPNFVVMQNLDQSQIESRFGSPDKKLPCAGTEIWVYDHVVALPS